MSIFNLIKRTLVSRKTADSGQFPVAQVSWNGKVGDIEVIYPYGLSGNLPIDSLVLTFNVNGQEENRAGIGNTPKRRFKNLKEGEVAVGNPLTKSVIKFLENGDIEITGTNNQNINITGDVNLTVGGNLNITTTGNTTITTTGNTTIDSTGNMSSTIGGTLTANVTGNTSLTSPVTTITGELRVTGEITAFFGGTPITMTDIKTTFNAHTHNENDAAPAPTAGPNSSI